MANRIPLQDLLTDINNCRLCEPHLPLGARPIVRASSTARLLIIGQAPGTRVHKTGIPWNDPSGTRLRQWLNMNDGDFYNEEKVAIVPMGFCYPGKGKSGDLPPRPECAKEWHHPLMNHLPNIQLTLLIGQYAQKYYLQDGYKTLTERVRNWDTAPEGYLPLPHPSPRNQIWLKKNPWFDSELLPTLKERVYQLSLN